MPKIKAGGRHFYYETEGSGPPLVLIAGYTGDVHRWDLLRTLLSGHFQLILFDNRGSGRSDPADVPYSIEDMAADTMALIQELGLKKPHILGSSMGSAVAQVIALQHDSQIGKVVLAHSFLKIPPVCATAFRFLFHLRMDKVHPARIVEGVFPWIFSSQFFQNDKAVAEAIDQSLHPSFPQSETEQKLQLDALLAFDSTKWFEKIGVPLLLILGEEDMVAPPRDIAAQTKEMANVQVHIIPKMAHMIDLEAPEEFLRLVLNFLKA